MSEDDAYRKCVTRFSTRHMSNAKWRKLFTAWARSGVVIDHAEWRFIDSENVMVKPLPKESQLRERRFADGLFQPFEYKWILSVRIPKRFRPKPDIPYEREQDTTTLLRVAKAHGQLPVYEAADALLVLAYEA